MHGVLSVTMLAIWLGLFSSSIWGQTVAGRIEQVEGMARIYDKAQNMRQAVPGQPVNEGDTIVTGADAEVHLAMADEGQLAVRQNTRVTIAKYRADGGGNDGSVISLVQGALRSITGWIGRYNPNRYAIRTPTATIGVRGTDHETMVVVKGGEGEAGTYDRVNAGETVLSTRLGQTVVRPNQAGFASVDGKVRPRLLASVPHFFRPARLDPQFRGLHERVRQRIETRRDARIEKLRELRQHPGAGANVPVGPERRLGAPSGDARDGVQQRRIEQRQRELHERRESLAHQREPRREQGSGERYKPQESPRRPSAGDDPPAGRPGGEHGFRGGRH